MLKTLQVWTGTFPTLDATGALATPSVGPVGTLYVAGVADGAAVTISGSNPYKFSVTLPALTAGQSVEMYVTATIAGIATSAIVAKGVADTVTLSDLATPTNITAGTINSVSGSVGGKVLGGGDDEILGIGAQVASSGGLTAQQTRDAMLLAPTAGTPADGSIDDHLDDLATALAAATATLTVVSAVDGGEIDIYQAVSLSATISGLAIPPDWTKVYWTVKRATSEADTDAILQLVETNPAAGTDGLLRLNGAAGTAANGTLTVNQAAGTVVIDLVMTICDDLALATGLVWSLKALRPTSASTLLAIGTLNVRGQATAAVA